MAKTLWNLLEHTKRLAVKLGSPATQEFGHYKATSAARRSVFDFLFFFFFSSHAPLSLATW